MARLAESTQRLVGIVYSWNEAHGVMTPKIQNSLEAPHLHACLRQLGVDVVGLERSTGKSIVPDEMRETDKLSFGSKQASRRGRFDKVVDDMACREVELAGKFLSPDLFKEVSEGEGGQNAYS